MTATAQLRISGQVTGLPGGATTIGPIDLSSASANGQTQWVVLASGANTITVPASPTPTYVVITLNPSNVAAVTLKGISGDTGIALGTTGTAVIPLSSVSSFVLNSASTQTGLATQIVFF